MSSVELRRKVLYLYKELLYMGKEYPQGYDFFRGRLKRAFKNNSGIKDPKEIEKRLEHGEYIKKELIALYTLRTYRAVKNKYYN
ncbi:hypothetical protein TRVA0_002S01112 [Trichomonascus vanleenenianus]|uniref:electron transfer flavoprotein regulatory factor 1 n=1 Tax=Trichomonascus vanleenenianus TaxID=2268995 RepID=UPI003ECB6936